MPGISAVESHPMRQKIIDAILAGQTLKQITAWTVPSVSTASICRFKRNALAKTGRVVNQAVADLIQSDANLPHYPDSRVSQSVTQVALAVASDPFLCAITKSATRRERWMKDIEDAGDYGVDGPDYKALATLDRNDLTGLELHARLAGRLDNAKAEITINALLNVPR